MNQNESMAPQEYRLQKEISYPREPVQGGYTGKTLHVDVTTGEITIKDIQEDLKEVFTGGRGFGLWYLWQGVTSKTRWDDAENEIVISCGPIGGVTQYPGAGKSYVVTLSPLTGIPVDSNVGGYFGPYLKFSGFDALELQGKAKEDLILFIDGDAQRITLEKAPPGDYDNHILAQTLTEKYASSPDGLRFVSVVSAGSGGDHTCMGLLNFSYYDVHKGAVQLKQAGRGGIGTVFRNKKIRALVVKSSHLKGDSNGPADLEALTRLGKKIHKEIREQDPQQNNMRKTGTTFLTGIMNDYDLLPVNNFQYGQHPKTQEIKGSVWAQYFTPLKASGCWYGCTLGCVNFVQGLTLQTGPYQGMEVAIDGPEYETIAGVGSNCGIFDVEIIMEVNFYCDTYGIDTISFGTCCAFLMECYEAGILTLEMTGGLELNFGSASAQLELLHQMARGEGFGPRAGQGIRALKEWLVEKDKTHASFLEDIGMECKGLEFSEYVSKESLAQQGGYGMANKGPQHDEAWLIFMDMVNNELPTFEDKAEALHYFPMFRTWFSLVGLCKLPWNDVVPGNNNQVEEPNKVPEHVDNYVRLFQAVTGKKITPQELILQSERVYNFQRVFNLRMGQGLRCHDDIPYRAVGPVTPQEYESRAKRYDTQLQEEVGIDPTGKTTLEKLQLLREYREDRYEQLKDTVYTRRGWTDQGVPTLLTLKRLGIDYPSVLDIVKRYLEAE